MALETVSKNKFNEISKISKIIRSYCFLKLIKAKRKVVTKPQTISYLHSKA